MVQKQNIGREREWIVSKNNIYPGRPSKADLSVIIVGLITCLHEARNALLTSTIH